MIIVREKFFLIFL